MSEAESKEKWKLGIEDVDTDSKNRPSTVNSSLDVINKFKGILD